MSPARDLQLVIFDCDGVLVDSEVISNEVLARALSAEGLPTTLPQARRDFQGLLLEDIVARAEAKLGRELPDDWLERYERDRDEAFRRELRPIPGAAGAVKRISAVGVAVCVASQAKLEEHDSRWASPGCVISSTRKRCSRPTPYREASRTPTCSYTLRQR